MDASDEKDFIERRIIVGLIASTDFVKKILPALKMHYLCSSAARTLASWCLEHFQKYGRAPGRDIEGIFVHHLGKGMPEARAEDIESILSGLSSEHDHTQFNVEYLTDQALQYFRKRSIEDFISKVKSELDNGDSLTEAEHLASSYAPLTIVEENHTVEPFEKGSFSLWKQAFEKCAEPIVQFPKALGQFWNRQLVRGGFIALMGPEKSQKSFWLMEMAMQSLHSGCNVAFFQAGDMSEKEQLIRIGVYLARQSNMAQDCGELWLPVMDCVSNQLGTCNRETREGVSSPLKGMRHEALSEMTRDELLAAYKNNPDHTVCHNCPNHRGTPWLRHQAATSRLTAAAAYRKVRHFQKKQRNRFKLCTYPNETLTICEIRSWLEIWERQDGFIADVIIVDYADILDSDPDCRKLDFRQQTGRIWQRLRRLSQEKHCLVITATLSSAKSYDQRALKISHFSEDKRKNAHVTALYGLNQTEEEKRIGIQRINALVVRSGEFDRAFQVKVLQRLQIGRPFLESYF